MEIKRREDSEKQKQLQDSIKRDLIRFIKIWNENKKLSIQEREVQEEMEKNLSDNQPNRREEYWQGDIVYNVVDVYEAALRIQDDSDKIDILSFFDQCKSYDKDKRTIKIQNTVKQICNLTQIKNNTNFKKYLDNFDNLYLELWFSDEKIKCIAPQLPPNESVTLKDIYTTFKPRFVLHLGHARGSGGGGGG
eukprot:34286_1